MIGKPMYNDSFILVTKKPFEDWLLGKMNLREFKNLGPQEKRELFLCWKWGFTNKISNEALEGSEKETLKSIGTIEDWSKLREDISAYYTKKIEWNNYCVGVWQSIENGMFFGDEQARHVAKEFGGSIV